MLLPDAREAIVTTCQELSRAGLVIGTAQITAVGVKLAGYGQRSGRTRT
jgi:hypothetical protein